MFLGFIALVCCVCWLAGFAVGWWICTCTSTFGSCTKSDTGEDWPPFSRN